jgi:MFS family permease
MSRDKPTQIKSLVGKFEAYSFFDNFVLIYPLYAVLFSDRGLSPVQISSLFAIWSITSFVLEIPSGSLADKFPRKNILVAAMLAKLLGFSLWLFVPNYWGFLLGFILWGVKESFTSGTREALVYDELKRAKRVELYTKVMGRMESFSLFGMIAAGLGASVLAKYGYNTLLVLSLLSIAVSGIILYLFPTVAHISPTGETKYIDYLREGVRIVLRKPVLLFFVLSLGILTGLGAADEYFSLIFRDKGLSNSEVALWLAIIYIFGAIGSYWAHRIQSYKTLLSGGLFIGAALLLGVAVAPSVAAPLMAGIYMMFLYAVAIVFNTNLQKQANDKTRATTTSVGNFVSESFGLITIAIISFGATHMSYSYGVGLAAILVLLIGAGLWLYSKQLNPLG